MLVWLKRDIVVLVVAWGVSLWGCLAALTTFYSYDPSGEPLLGIQNWENLILYGLLLVGGLLLLLPIVVFARRTLFDRIIERLQQDWLLLLLVTSFSIYPVFRVYKGGSYILPVLGLLQAGIVALLVLWFFYRRQNIALKALILTLTWGFLLLHLLWLRINLSELQDLPRVVDVSVAIVLGFIALAPVAAQLQPMRQIGSRLLNAVSQLPMPTLVLALAASLLPHVVFWFGRQFMLAFLIAIVFELVALLVVLALAWKIVVQPVAVEEPSSVSAKWLLPVVGFYVLLAIPLAINWMGSFTADGLAYMQIARRYAGGEFVVRGLWSPLLSWILAPPIRLGLDPEVAARILALLNNALCIVLTYILAGRLLKRRLVQLGAAVAMALLLLRHGFWPITPGIYAMMLLMVYFILITHPNIQKRPLVFGLLSGIFGALAYFARAFNLPYVFAHLVLTGLILVKYHGNRLWIGKLIGAGQVGLWMLSLPWVYLLSHKFGRVLISTAPLYAKAKYGPEHPIFQSICFLQLCTDRPDHMFGWEDAAMSLMLPFDWSPLDSWEAFWFKLLIIRNNVGWWPQTILDNLGFWAIACLIGLIVLVIIRWDADNSFPIMFVLMSILLYVAGYQYGDAAELRYYYPILPMFVVMVLYFVDLLLDYSSPFLPVWTQVLLVALPAVTLALRTTAHTPTDVTIFAGPEPFCDLAQIVEAKPSFTEPMVGDDFVIHHVSYHAQVRSTGIVPATNAQAVN